MTVLNKTLSCQSYLVWKSTSHPIQWLSQTKTLIAIIINQRHPNMLSVSSGTFLEF